MKKIFVQWPLMVIFFLLFCCKRSSDPAPNPPAPNVTYSTIEAFPALSFSEPLDIQYSTDNTNRLFVVERQGVIYGFHNDPSTAVKSLFLDLKGKVDSGGDEKGLLGLAFHPDYQTNGFFYVNYTAGNPRRTVVSRFKVSSSPDMADPLSEVVILTFPQPYDNHNGGQLAFGADGFLYIAVGDGGGNGDPQGNGQSLTTLLGKILRIDVNKQEATTNYGIPSDNPFANNTSGYREEIYAYGMRNPWRFSFDTANHQLWVADVGQNAYEEIDLVEKGSNYGWKNMEGKHCYSPTSNCVTTGLSLPVYEYGRSEGISVTGGYVYRGPTLKQLQGTYVFGDFGSKKIWSLDISNLANPVATLLTTAEFYISAFGTDQFGEIYICGFDEGKLFKLKPSTGQ